MKKLICTLFSFVLLAFCYSITSAQPFSWPEIRMNGDTVWHIFPPSDTTYLHDRLVLKFKQGALDYTQLCYDCDTIVESRPNGKGAKAMSYDQDYFSVCKQTLMSQEFNPNIILDPTVKTILTSNGVTHLMRMTAANPCVDTLSISRFGDTVPMNHYNWMVAYFNNDTSIIQTITMLFIFNNGQVEIAEPDFIFDATTSTPADPMFSGGPQKSLGLIGMTSAWDFEVGDDVKTVAVVDNGVDYWRCDLGNGIGNGKKVIGGWNYTTKDMTHVYQDAFHGTQVAAYVSST
ncbi:MAG TPA: hypothetical protein VFO76_05915 [Candidatus Kapabacteria bacterium]|nr:hypothetical protein [Candidatus Kapabacteria bacterium]